MSIALLALAGAIATGATASSSADPGVTAKTILLGGTAPLSGPDSAFASIARGADAYFKYVNARSGVNGRTIAYKVVDDGSDPVETVQATRQLVEQDKVFAIFNSFGTEHNVATRAYLNQLKVPQLFVASGATTFGRDHKRYPTTIGFQPSYEAEGWIYGTYLARTKQDARIGVLFQNDDYGRELLAGLRRGILRSKVKVVAAEGYEVADPDVQSQIEKLKAAGANTLALFAMPTFAIQAYAAAERLGWRPLIIVNEVSSAASIMTGAAARNTIKTVEGSISITYLKDPTDAKWRTDAAMKLYRSVLARYARGANAKDVHHVHGMAVAFEAVRALKAAGTNPTRTAVLAQARKLNDPSNPFLLPGISVRTSETERFPIEQAALQRWSQGSWKSFGGLWSYRAG